MIIDKIIRALIDTLKKLDYPQKEIKVSSSSNPDYGDLSSSLPLMLAKDLEKNPIDIAKIIMGNQKNMKITYEQDLEIIKTLL